MEGEEVFLEVVRVGGREGGQFDRKFIFHLTLNLPGEGGYITWLSLYSQLEKFKVANSYNFSHELLKAYKHSANYPTP